MIIGVMCDNSQQYSKCSVCEPRLVVLEIIPVSSRLLQTWSAACESLNEAYRSVYYMMSMRVSCAFLTSLLWIQLGNRAVHCENLLQAPRRYMPCII